MTTAWAPAPEDLEAYRATESTPHDPATTLRYDVHDALTFAKADPDLIVGMAVVKPGVFNGVFEVTRDMLDAWVERFEELRGTFRPPMRLDHSWEVGSVIGRFEALRVENRADDSAGGAVVPMLVGDWRIVGTAAERKLVREWIGGDKLNERSSEFYPYRTNAGADYPSVFAGCAFVDIPAVEGLGSITLRRDRATLAADLQAPETEDPAMADDQPTTTEPDAVDDAAAQTPETPAVETPTEPVLVIAAPEPDATDDEDEGDAEGDAGDVVASLRAAGITLTSAQRLALERDIEARVALRLEADERITRFRAKGVLVPAIAGAAEALLRHDDKAVRDHAAAILDIASPPVALRQADGVTQTPDPAAGGEDGTASPSELRKLDVEEFAEQWAALSSAQRKQPEYLAAYAAVTGATR